MNSTNIPYNVGSHGNMKHGGFGTRLYSIWGKMKSRCNNTMSKDYIDYGGRGIKVCTEWNSYEPFAEWSRQNGYDDSLTIDRKDVNGDYSPENCRWATAKQQANNRRSSHYIEYLGVTKTLQQWSEEIGLKSATIRYRLKKGWSVEDALTKELY